MNHGRRFDEENEIDRKRRLKEQEKKQKLKNRIDKIEQELYKHQSYLPVIERILKIV